MKTKSFDEELLHVIWTRKPGAYTDVDTTITEDEIRELGRFERYKEIEILPGGINTDFVKDMPQFFILETKSAGDFLVDTQGYSYLRYITKIVK